MRSKAYTEDDGDSDREICRLGRIWRLQVEMLADNALKVRYQRDLRVNPGY